jgi:S1-C subfamily serine protease
MDWPIPDADQPTSRRTTIRKGVDHMQRVAMRSLPSQQDTAIRNIAALLLLTTALVPVGLAEASRSSDETPSVAKASSGPSNTLENSVVKIFATVCRPDFYKPWTKSQPAEATGSGVVIQGKRILSNAHVVAYARRVEVQASQAGDKLSATVEAIDPGIDLAVLKLDDETFFDSHLPLPLADALPDIKDTVMAYGYPEGGNSLSITKGIVSRIEFTPYNFSVSGLRIQIDAAINPGNSGGPAVANGKMIGVAFSRLENANNIGYIIPSEEIELFLEGIAGGNYDGKSAMFDSLQTLESPALRAFLKLDKSVEGIVVQEPDGSDATYPLKEWDVITKIAGTPVDDQGMIKLSETVRVKFQYLVQKRAKNGKVPLTVVRNGKEISIELPVSPKHPEVIPDIRINYPSYFIYGPLVFSAASKQYVGPIDDGTWAGWTSGFIRTANALVKRYSEKPSVDGEALVVVSSPFFPHKVAKGYSNPIGRVVKTVNGNPIKSLADLVVVLRDSRTDFIAIKFDVRESETMVFSRKDMLSATGEILADYDIRSQGSPDVMAIWNAKPPL